MIVKIECKKCKHILMTIVASVIPEWINKWINKNNCPECNSINWGKGEQYAR